MRSPLVYVPELLKDPFSSLIYNIEFGKRRALVYVVVFFTD